ncbi:MAG: DUF1311 domain-containing protein [Kurthia sp.]|nr:DUF1311 domain-containing protein [Candidatus Kurthia equi]
MKFKLGYLVLTGILLAGCGNETTQPEQSSTFTKATEQAKLALADGNTDKALASFELALEEDTTDEKTKNYVKQLQKVVTIEDFIHEKKYKKAISHAKVLLEDEDLLPSVENITQDLLASAEKSVTAQSKKTKENVEKTTSTQQTTTQKTQQTAPTKQDNMYAIHMNQAQLIETNYVEPAYAIDGEAMDSFTPMLNAFNASYAQWDKLLNDIYGTLKSRLSANEFESLRSVQRNWIKQRDSYAQAAFNNPGDYAAEIAKAQSLSNSTSSRCYELLYQYQTNLQ